MFCAEIVERIFTSFHKSYLITLGKDVTLPLITKFKKKQGSEKFICKSNTELKCGLTD